MTDVVVVGAGPAGAVAATVLARAGVRVRLLDRAAFPRHKLCGDTLNPGTLAILRGLGLSRAAESDGLELLGMRVTGERGAAIEGGYPRGLRARAISRRALDWALVEQAIAAGAQFEPGVPARGVVAEGEAVGGVTVGCNGHSRRLRARVTIAADGRRSSLAFGIGASRHPSWPRRWVVGAYFCGVHGLTAFGEMHIRKGRYIGVAPLPGGLANVCLVKPSGAGDPELRDPAAALAAALARESLLRDRFADARMVGVPAVLGPLAVDAIDATRLPDGLLMAGDAAGFIDPMTGDGLRFAVRGGELAASAAMAALEHGWSGAHASLAARRRAEFAGKHRVNRALRAFMSSPAAVGLASSVAPLAPWLVRALIARAGDCDIAGTLNAEREEDDA